MISNARVAILGATGAVGQEFIQLIEERNFPYRELKLLASKRSAGKELTVKGKKIIVEEATPDSFNDIDIALFAGGSVSKTLAPEAAKRGAIVIDNSSQWRMAEDVDLIVPEVNEPQFTRGIIANPNCSTIQSVVPLKILQDAYGLKRVAYTTYQAVSGSGVKGKRDLAEGANGKEPEAYPYPIYNNVLPHIDVFLENGYTKEEQKMIDETKKILNDQDLKVTATCVRVPVQDSHSIEIDVTLNQDTTVKEIQELFAQDQRVVLVDNPSKNEYPLAIHSTGKDEVFVGRIRRDDSLENTFHVWCTSDNLLKGAALNAVQVLEQILTLKGAR
ncbi:MAG: aspartate-semialdehyde dehydrogenase [Staphylococcus epidermidis]|nr:aspartate-semialdehyde dehydrogenase [Staphylococcus epidermidis]